MSEQRRKSWTSDVVIPKGEIDSHIVTFHSPDSTASDQYRAIFSNLSSNFPTAHAMVLTSASEKEGRSTALLNLAATIALETGKRVLAVDCDLYQPSLHEYLRLSLQEGLADALHEKTDVLTVIQKTLVPNLFLLSAGTPNEHSFGIFTSREIKNIVHTLREQFDYLLFDSPPIGRCPDAGLLGKIVDGVILVIAAELTQREAAEIAKEKLESLQVKILGCILTRYPFHIPALIYKYIHRG